jgi:pyrimidine deaminase RibD-like protein
MKERSNSPEYSIAGKDHYLKRAIELLEGSWQNSDTGIVVAGLIDSDRQTYATSSYAGEDKWDHAEKKVLNNFTKTYGEPSKDAFVVVTMSPCTKPSKSRVGDPCSNLLLEKGITSVHIGHLDTKQTRTIEELEKMGFDITLAQDELVKQKSKKLYDFFINNYKLARELGGNPWPKIKSENPSPFK